MRNDEPPRGLTYEMGGQLKTDWVVEAIQRAQQQGMVPFVVVMPVSPELMADAARSIEDLLASEAADQMRRAVRSYQESVTQS